MSKSSVDRYMESVLHLADLPFSDENAEALYDCMSALHRDLYAGLKLREWKFTTLGQSRVAVGYPGMTRNSPAHYEMRERKCISIGNGDRHYHLQWADPNDRSKGLELAWYSSRDLLARFPIN